MFYNGPDCCLDYSTTCEDFFINPARRISDDIVVGPFHLIAYLLSNPAPMLTAIANIYNGENWIIKEINSRSPEQPDSSFPYR